MWKLILGGIGLILLPLLVGILQLASSGSKSPGGSWGEMPLVAIFSFPLFWGICLVAGLVGLGIGTLIDISPKVPMKTNGTSEGQK